MYVTFLLLEISMEKKTNHTNLEVNQMLNPILVLDLIILSRHTSIEWEKSRHKMIKTALNVYYEIRSLKFNRLIQEN